MSKLIPVITLLSRLLEIPRGKRSRAYPSVTQGNSTQLSSRGLARHLLCKMSPKEVVKVHHLLRSVIKLCKLGQTLKQTLELCKKCKQMKTENVNTLKINLV